MIFLSTRLWMWKAVFSMASDIVNNPTEPRSKIFYIFWNEWLPYLYSYERGGNGLHFEQWYLTEFRICPEITSSDNSFNRLTDCTTNPITPNSVEIFTNFFSTVQAWDLYDYYYSNPNTTYSYPYWYLCVSSSDRSKSLCFYGGCSPRSTNSLCQDLTWSLWLMPNLSFQDLDSFYLWNSPAVPNYNQWENNSNPIWNPDFEEWFNFTPVESGDLVFYFENSPYYKYDVDICYVWTDNFEALYDQNSSHIYMSNSSTKTVFDLFSYLYWNTFNITNVGSFINTWDLNYDQHYQNADLWFNSYYSLASWYYQEFWDNLTNPFVWNPVALFYMWYNVNHYWRSNTQWEEIATYCYYKLWLDENSGWLTITDDSNSSYRENAGGFIDNRNRSHVYFSWSDSIVSQSWEWSIMDYFTWDDNLDFSNFFAKSFNLFKDRFTLNPNDLWVWFLPSYIFLFLMALIIFRFLSH